MIREKELNKIQKYTIVDLIFVRHMNYTYNEYARKVDTVPANIKILNMNKTTENILDYADKKYGVKRSHVRYNRRLFESSKNTLRLAHKFKLFLLDEKSELLTILGQKKYTGISNYVDFLILEGMKKI